MNECFFEWLFFWIRKQKKVAPFLHLFLSHIHIYIPYFDLMYVYLLLILLPAMELEQWEDCSLSLEKKTVTLKMSIFNYSQNKKVQRKTVINNQQPAVFIVFV